jgi:hypothetical protein
MFEKNNKLYNELTELSTFEVSKLKIPFNNNWNKIAINLSGGADSACLAMLLCNHIQNLNLPTKVYIITYIRCWNTRPWQQPVAVNVYNNLKNLYPDIIQDQIFCYIPPELEHGAIGNIIDNRSADQITVSSFNEYAAFVHKFNAIFNATSKNPSGTEFEDRMKNRDIDIDSAALHDLLYIKKEVVYSMPFKYVEKDWIVAQYKIFDQWKLFESTRSCEGDFVTSSEIQKTVSSLNDYVPGDDVHKCGLCFWCKERQWALRNLDVIIEKITD